MRQIALAALLVLAWLGAGSAGAQAQARVALVIGNAGYQSAPALRTTVADARMMTETLRAAGFDVTEHVDLRAESIGEAIRAFLDKVAAGGPQTIAFFYYAGHAAQSGGENFLIPVDAQIAGEADVENEAFRLSDMMEELAQMQAAARIVVIDGAREHGLGRGGQSPVSPGLAIMTAPTGALVAFSAAPGAVAPESQEENSLYATTLVTLMREPGLDIEQVFKSVRVEVNKITDGAQTPWMASALEVEISLFDREAADPGVQVAPAPPRAAPLYVAPRRARAVVRQDFEGLAEEEAYRLAVEQDTLAAYQWFLEIYPRSPYAAQVWEIVAVRREAILWRRALAQNTARAYWNYLRRYPNGVYVAEAQAQLEALSEPIAPPPHYVVSPEPLPPDYYDEGVDLPELVPEGEPPPPPVWGFGAPYQPYYVAPPPPRVVRPWRWHHVRPPPPPFVVVRPPRIVPRPPHIDRHPPPRWVRPVRPEVRPGVGRPGGRPGIGERPVRPPRAGVSLPPRGGAPGVGRPVRPGVGLPPGAGPRPGVRPGVALPPARVPRPGVGLPPRAPGVTPGPGRRPVVRPGMVPGEPPRSGRIPPGRPPRPDLRPPRPQVQPPRPSVPPRPQMQPPRPQMQPRPPVPPRPQMQPPRPQMQPRPPVPPRPQMQPPRPQMQPRPPVPPRPQMQPPRPQMQPRPPVPPRPQMQPPRPQMQPRPPVPPRPQMQPPRPMPQPPRPQMQPPRPMPQPPRPAAQPPRPAPQPSCPPGTRNVGGRCAR